MVILIVYQINFGDCHMKKETYTNKYMARTVNFPKELLLKIEEMQQLIDELFACMVPNVAPDGSKVLRIIQVQELNKLIEK